MTLNEAIVEDAALTWFDELGYAIGRGLQFAPGEPAAERESFAGVVLEGRLRQAIRRLNPVIPDETLDEALRKVLRVGTPSLTQTNRAFHRMLRDGVEVEYARPDGSIAGDHVRLVAFGDVAANDWMVVNQFTVVEGQHHRRPDVVVFVNGLPLGMIELKNAADEDATIWSAYAQLQTYKAEIPSLLHYNAALVVSDGLQARVGSLTANQEWFKVWRTIEGEGDAPKGALELEVLITKVRQSVTIDWTLRESARAKIRVMVKRILNKHGYPPDLQDEAVRTVLRQAELLCVDLIGAEQKAPPVSAAPPEPSRIPLGTESMNTQVARPRTFAQTSRPPGNSPGPRWSAGPHVTG